MTEIVIAVVGAAFVVAALIYFARELVIAERNADGWRNAYYRVVRELVQAETDLTIARMLHGGELDRLRRQLESDSKEL